MDKSKEEQLQECDLIADLLPIYLDAATQEETNGFIEEHLAGCECCRKNYEWMKSSLPEVLKQEGGRSAGRRKRKHKMFKKVKWKMLLYGYVCLLILIWLYCILDLVYFF